ncbi:disease resistance protein RPP8-like [Macadamia integrifolia]|uniref:disease resistance protein RPP8-like n=1 Tax=Macadamia integrifolia TaxID=60698 RepID=UPI001C4F713B|nr:disease resistance protein RPP8-like [Macadamia integrifolia]
MTEATNRAVLSLINNFTNTISQEKSHWETVEGEVEPILSELLDMRRFLKDVDEEIASEKILELEKIIHKTEAAIKEFAVRTTRRGRRWKSLFKSGGMEYCGAHKKSLIEIKMSIEELKNYFEGNYSRHYSRRKKSFNLGARLSERLRSFASDETEEDLSPTVVGLRQDMVCLEKELNDGSHNHRVISVLGIQGIGKTTLAWKIYKSSFVVERFQCKAWVCVSAESNNEAIYKQIENQKYLIVIDDVPDLEVWKDLLRDIPNGDNGSRIILTTRDVEVACSADYSHRMKVLSKEESWDLFEKKVCIAPWKLRDESGREHSSSSTTTTIEQSTIRFPPELAVLGKQMVKKCGGIPFLIIELANLLSRVYPNTEEWSCVLHGTDTHLGYQDKNPWYKLSYSVDDILPLHVKQFLHLFPAGADIPERRLILSWAAESLWQQQQQQQQQQKQQQQQSHPDDEVYDEEAVAMRWVRDLQDLGFIQASKVSSIGTTKTYRIPPDLPQLQILKAGGGGGSGDSKVWIHRICDQYKEDDPHSCCIHSNSEELKTYKSVRYFWCFNYPGGYKPGQELGSFLKRCINNNYLWFLRVLDLESVYKPSLPKAIGELINLRYLGLRWTFLDTLPESVHKLHTLQTLDIKHTDIGDYPKKMFRNMHSLRHIYLNERHPSEVVTQLSCLSSLQTLSGVIVDDSSPVKDGLDKLKKLRKLRLTCRLSRQQEVMAMAKWIAGLKDLRTLKLTTSTEQEDDRSSLLWNLRSSKLSRMYLQGKLKLEDNNNIDYHQVHDNDFGNLTALTLSLTQLDTDPMPILEKLPVLKLLRLFSKSFMGSTMSCSAEGFSQLRVLKLWKLETLERWTVANGAMKNLDELEIRSCKKLEFPNNLPINLRELKLTDMPKEFTTDVTEKRSHKVANVSSVVIEDWLDSSVKLYTGRNREFQC